MGRQGQSYALWGLDVAADVPLSSQLSLAGTYSWVSYDTLSSGTPDIPVLLVIPNHNAAIELVGKNQSRTLHGSLRARGVGAFGQRGLFRDPTASAYRVLDVSTTYRLPP